MSDRLAADAVLVFHIAFVLFALFGGLLVLRNRRWLALHLPALAWGIWIEASHGLCPLTPIENHFRHRAGQVGYEGGCIEHYLLPLLYPAGLTPHAQAIIAVGFALWSLVVYALVWRRYRQR